MTPFKPPAPRNFLEEVEYATPGDSRLLMCIQCGTCGGSCPSAKDMDHSPRTLFAMIRAGMREEVFTSNTPWYCVSCYYCMVRCPQDIHITDIMYTLKNMAINSEFEEAKDGSTLARLFADNVENYGRSFEFGLASRHALRTSLRHAPGDLFKKARLGIGMFSRGRLELTPDRIDGMDQLNAILDKAKALEAET